MGRDATAIGDLLCKPLHLGEQKLGLGGHVKRSHGDRLSGAHDLMVALRFALRPRSASRRRWRRRIASSSTS